MRQTVVTVEREVTLDNWLTPRKGGGHCPV